MRCGCGLVFSPRMPHNSVSPGLVETEFAFRLHNNDPEKAAATYESLKCLKAEDLANAVVYILSTPSHVQIGDLQMRPTEQLL